MSGWSLTGTSFDDGTPAAQGAAFVHSVVRFVDLENPKPVPKMTERVVAKRRQGIIMLWRTLPKATSGK
jgi:hypothetical protein